MRGDKKVKDGGDEEEEEEEDVFMGKVEGKLRLAGEGIKEESDDMND